ncbi:SpaA isopeptide-forming pilin-related protein [Paenibacillus sp. IITD108]|uniref:SpaA isopeptide-forming pilin-related protein n=1 Tax=Paenibacillus sp. IITD108 TaxID=3116649 RepID=UPI002F4267E8
MRKYAKIFWICLLAVALQLGSISAVLVSYAAGNDVTGQVLTDFITEVDLKEKTGVPGNPLGNTLFGQTEIDKNIEFWLYYEFHLPNDHTIEADDYIIFDVPAAISLPPSTGTPFEYLRTEDGDVIANAYIEPGNKIKVVFTAGVTEESNVGGAFFLAGGFNQSEINTNGDSTDIQFTDPSKTITLTFEKDFVPPPPPVSVQKSGALVNGTDIKWTIVVNSENVAVENATLIDAIPASQVLDQSTITLNNVALASGDFTVSGNTLSIPLGDIDSQQTISFVTNLDPAALAAALEEGKTSINVTNNAHLTHDGDKTTNADNPATVPIPINILSKSGSKLSPTTANNTKNIKWTIVVNEDGLQFNDAVIKDKLPAGLTFVAGSAIVTGASTVAPVISGSNITFNLGNITDKVTITYETEIAPDFFQKNGYYDFKNEAELSWAGLAAGAGVVNKGSVGVGSNLFTKSGAGYNRANGVISWSISINNENIKLAAPTISDVIPSSQQYIAGSAKIVDANGNAYSGGTFGYNSTNKTLTYTFGADINSKYTITFDTKPENNNVITANSSGSFGNTANFTSGSISFNSTGTQTFASNVFKKQNAGYNAGDRYIKWKLVVNENGSFATPVNPGALDPLLYSPIKLNNVKIVDEIPAGLNFVPSQVVVKDKNGNTVNGLVTATETTDANGKKVTFEFNQGITEMYTIEFVTEVVDLSKFTKQNGDFNNGSFNITNKATLTHDETNIENVETATETIKNHIVSKKGVVPIKSTDSRYIDWIVYINSNAVDLNQLLGVKEFWLIDILKPGLELDTSSVTLTKYAGPIQVPNSIPADLNDGLGAGTNVPLDGSNIKYDSTTNEFRFDFPYNAADDQDSIKHAYKLSFRTYTTENVANGTSFTNSINLFGTNASGEKVEISDAYKSNDSKTVSFIESGSIAYGNLGTITVNKVDLDTPSKALSGAKFALYDRYGNKVQETTTVDGKIEFKRIKLDLPYYVKEEEAPVGYLISGDVSIDDTPVILTTAADVAANTAAVAGAAKVELKSAQNQKSLDITFKNQVINADIRFEKKNENNGPLQGAVFGLFARGAAADSAPITTATSSATGEVLFADVPYGQYDIREVTAPSGYRTLTGVVHAVEVTAADHETTLQLSAVTNALIKANMKFVKKDNTGNELEGVEFTLFNSSNQSVAVSESDEDGIVEFQNILAGTYTIRETNTPFGYVPLTGNVHTVTVAEAQHGTTIPLADVTNTRIQSSIEFIKNNENGAPLAGATFGLYDGQDALVQSKTSLSDGKVTFTNIGEGSYTIKEISPPTGYVPITGVVHSVTVTAGDHNDTITLGSVANTLIEADIKFVKQNENNGPLQGAVFGLFERGAAAGSTPVTTATSSATGEVLFEDVPYGQYDIREITAPFGYRTLSGVVHAVEVTAAKHATTIEPGNVSNELIKANIKFVKLDNSGNELKGAEFTLFNGSDQAVAVSESDEDGIVEFIDVLAGTYTIRETKTPFGYLPLTGDIGTVTVEEAQHGTTISLADVTNTLIQSSIEFIKNNENSAPLAGATFGLYDGQDALVQSKTSLSDGKVTFTNIGEGSYTIKEISPPYGYVPITGVVHSVTVKAGDHNNTITLGTVANTLIEANIEFVKIGNKGQGLAGAEFVLLDENEDVVQTVTSGTDGKVTFTDVREGEYVIREKTPPTGYNPLTTDVATVDINALVHNTTVTLPNVTNQIIKGDVEFVKVAKHSGNPLKNARFALYAADDTTLDYEIATATSDKDGIVRFEDVEYGDYTIIEVAPPSGYYLSKDKLSVSVTEEGKTYQLGNFENQYIPVMLIEGAIEVKKVNILDKPLAGAKFALYDAFGKLVAEAVSNSSGIARFAPVIQGVYTVEEVEAPKNYVKSDQVEKVTIAANQNDIKLTFVNERSSDAPWPSVTVQKVDDAGAAIAGVEFALYKAADTAFAAPIANSITDAKGVAAFTNVVPGSYVVKELKALEGYILSHVTLPITVTEDSQTFNAGTVENRVIRGDIVVTKVNELNQPLEGAEFGLYDKNNKLVTVAVSDSKGIASFENIPYGSYQLKELSAPVSYKKSDEVIAINITVDGEVKAYTIVNKKADDEDTEGENGGKPGKPTDPSENTDPNSGTGTPGTGSTDNGTNNGSGNGAQEETGSVNSGPNQSNKLPKTGDSISTMVWLFIGSGLLLLTITLVGRRRAHKQ